MMDDNKESQQEMPSPVPASEERQEEQSLPVASDLSQVQEVSSMDVTQKLMRPITVQHEPEQKQEEEPTLTLPHREKEQGRQPKPVPLGLNRVQWSSVINLYQSAFSSFKAGNWKKKRVVVIISVLCIVAVLAAIIFSVWKLLAPPDVTLYRVGFQNVAQSSGGGGIIYPRQQLHISFPIAERVVAVLVQPGDQVSPNQPLIQLDPKQLNAEMKQASADTAAHKYSALVAATTSPLLHNGSLVSPISGVVTAVNINPNEVFTANSNLLTIMDESTVIVHAKIPLSALEQIHPGQLAIVTPSALSNLSFKGSVKAIIPNTDAQTDTFEVWVEVVNSNGVLLPGMSAFVSIQESVRALVVPRLAVLNPDLESAVFIVRNQHAYLQHVQVLGYAGDSIIIGTGLSAGNTIVLVGLDSLRDGQEVHVTSVEGQSGLIEWSSPCLLLDNIGFTRDIGSLMHG